MHRSTILALAFAAVEASALLTKRDSASPEATTVTAVATATGETDVVTATSTDSSDPSASPTLSPADIEDGDNFAGVPAAAKACYPYNATSHPDFNAPCNQIAAIEAQCSYGPKALEFISLPADSDDYPNFNDPKWVLQSPENERTCVCQSQIIDATQGCMACLQAHKLPEADEIGALGKIFPSIMSRYCNTSYTPTQSFIEFASDAEDEALGDSDFGEDGSSDDEDSSSSTTASDPLGTSTDVSLYYTMSVTRTDAYDLAVPTGSNGNVTYTSTRTSAGEIVATAEAAKGSGSGGASGSEGAASTTSSADSGAATAQAGAAGLFAIAALAAIGL